MPVRLSSKKIETVSSNTSLQIICPHCKKTIPADKLVYKNGFKYCPECKEVIGGIN